MTLCPALIFIKQHVIKRPVEAQEGWCGVFDPRGQRAQKPLGTRREKASRTLLRQRAKWSTAEDGGALRGAAGGCLKTCTDRPALKSPATVRPCHLAAAAGVL